jgi:hypothetical protein
MNEASEPVPRPEAKPRPALSAMPPVDRRPAGPEDAAFVDYLYGVLRRGRFVLANALLVAAVAGLASLFLRNWYSAEGIFLPPVEERSSFSLTAFLREVAIPGAGLSDAVQAGDLSVGLLKSRHIRDSLVAEFDLVRRYDVRDIEDALVELDAHTTFFVSQEGLVTITVEDRDPEVAARLVNRSIELLDRFNAELRMTKGHRTRFFIEGELARTEAELRAAEVALERYQETNKLALSPAIESEVSASAPLMARKMETQIELGMKQSVLTEGHEELRRLRTELAQIDRQLAELPALGIEAARLIRDLKVREEVYGFLRAEYEQAKVQEQRDTPSLTVVDRATAPLRKSRPRRTLLAAGAGAVAAVLAVLGALAATWVDFLPPGDRRRETLSAAGRELRDLVRIRRPRR